MTYVHTTDGQIRFLTQQEQDAVLHAREHPDWPIHITVKVNASTEEIIRAVIAAEQSFAEILHK